MSNSTTGHFGDTVRRILREGIGVAESVERDAAIHATLAAAAERTAAAMKAGHKLMIAGNGGSAADAQHIAAEFVNRLIADRPALRAMALTTDTSILTSICNDHSQEQIFARQIEALGQSGDIFMGISTSGRSPNILRALELCRRTGIVTIGLTGETGGPGAAGTLAPLCDYLIAIPSKVTMYIQQSHLALEHIYCLLVERAYFGENSPPATGAAPAPKG